MTIDSYAGESLEEFKARADAEIARLTALAEAALEGE